MNIFSRYIFSSSLFFISILGLVLFSHSFAASFPDVPSSSKYYNAVEALAGAKIIKGYEDGTFRPDQKVNRVEALKMILQSAGISSQTVSSSDFSDVLSDQWFAPFVATAKAKGIVSGDGKTGKFLPAREVIKAEFLKMALLAFNHDVSKHNARINIANDVSNNAWYKSFMSYSRALLIISPDVNNNLYPEKKLTRGECVEIIYQLIILQKGGNVQKYLKLTESELLSVLLSLSKDDIKKARAQVDSATFYSSLALKESPETGIVKAANETALAMQDLISAYEFGLKKDYEALRDYANKAKEKAGIAYSYSSSTQPIGKKIKQYADILLRQAQ